MLTAIEHFFLSGNAQQNAIAFNLENILSSDLISTNNIFNGDNLILNNVMTKVEINQHNNLSQLHRSQGMLNTLKTGSRYEKTIKSKSGSEVYDYHSYSSEYQQRVSHMQFLNINERSANVGVRLTPGGDIATYSPPLELIGIRHFGPYSILGTKFSTLGLDLNSIGIEDGLLGTNLRLTTSLTWPELDLGEIDLGDVIGVLDLPSLGGGTTTTNLYIPGLGIHIEELNFGSGFSLSGDGSHTLIDPGGLTVGGEITLGLDAHAKLVIDLSKTILDIDKYTFLDESFSATVPIPFILINENFENESFDPLPGESGGSSEIITEQGNDFIEDINTVDIAESFLNESYKHTVLIGGQITGAETELLALSEGSISLDNSSNVQLSDNTQRNMQVFNNVNAVSSIAANALNISRLPSISNHLSAMPKISMQQHNNFIQQR